MFSTIKIHLAMFEEGIINEATLTRWLRFHAWIRKHRSEPVYT